MEHLSEHQRSLAVINEKLTNDEHNHTVVLGVWLAVSTNQLVLDLLEGKRHELVNDGSGALELLALESQQGLLAVQRTKGGSVSIESVVVVLDELTTDAIELGIHSAFMN